MQDKKSKAEIIKKRNECSRRYNVVLTKPEGEMLDKIISDNGCANLSQLCKKIVKGEVSLY
ncbi:MAG: hypothetical protein RR576_03365 [Oscillospiraceae bacterium]